MNENFEYALDLAKQNKDVAFPLAEYEGRLARIRAAMAEQKLDLLFLSSPEAIFYVTGFNCEWYQAQSPASFPPTSGVAVHVNADKVILFETPSEAVLTTLSTTDLCDVRIFPLKERRNGQRYICENLKAEGWLKGRIGLELRNYRPNPVVSEQFRATLTDFGLEIADATDMMAEIRRLKSDLEIAAHKEAARIADVGLNAAFAAIAPGVTELEVFGAMIQAMAKEGGEFPAILPPVASGIRSNCLHPLSGRREIQRNERVCVDTSGVYKRYHSNTARTCWVGDPPDDVVAFHDKTVGAFDIVAEMIAPDMEILPLLKALEDYYASVGILDEAYWFGGYETGIAFPPDWVGSLVYDLSFTKPGDRFAPMTVINHECNFFGPRGTGLSATIDAIIFEKDTAYLTSQIDRHIQVIEA